MMGLAMSYSPKSADQTRKCPLFEREKVDLYEDFVNTTKTDGHGGWQRRNSSVENDHGVNEIKVLESCAFVEDKLTAIEERRDVLRYVTPQFRAWAKVRVPPLAPGETWQIGWIQACSSMKFINTYGDKGCTSWEFQELDTGLYPMISDSDGRANPWYGTAKQNVRTIIGPTCESIDLMLMMHDNFYPSVTWSIPMPSKCRFPGEEETWDSRPMLTNISRDQTFYTWFVARNLNDRAWYVLRTARWRARVDISVNPRLELGSRAVLTHQQMSSGPLILPQNVLMPKCVLFPPNANSAQILVWRSASRQDRTYLVVPPKMTAVKYKLQRKLGIGGVVKPQISQCLHGRLNLIGNDDSKEHDTISAIETYLAMQYKAKDSKKMEKISSS